MIAVNAIQRFIHVAGTGHRVGCLVLVCAPCLAGVGILWGVVFLRERIEWNDLAGFLIILLGMALVLIVKPAAPQ
jgi:drug/metabolite transporter (DMT)-like permease